MSKIEFISTIEGILGSEECLPKPAKHFIPKWFKDIPSNMPKTVKQCPSFPDYFSQGYILPMWTDSILKHDKESRQWQWETPSTNITWDIHSDDQFIDYVNPSLNGVGGNFVFKTDCPWKIITPPGWSVLQLPLFYHFNKDWSVMPGIIDTDIHHFINQQVLYHSNKPSIKIKKGDPFVLYVPFKRDNVLELSIREQTEKDQKNIKEQDFRFKTSFVPNGIYRSLQRKRDKSER
jgi:hypothetical protein